MSTIQDNTKKTNEQGIFLSPTEAEFYRTYKRNQKLALLSGALSRSSVKMDYKSDITHLLGRAKRFHQASVKIPPSMLKEIRKEVKGSKLLVDCVIGGDGESFSKTKVYEAKLARRWGADELTLVLSPSLIYGNRDGELIKEVRRVRRVGRGAKCKVWMDKKYPFYTLARLARLLSNEGVDFFSVPYFEGCERLRYDLFRGCALEVCDVEDYASFKKMAGAGVSRVVTSSISEIYERWVEDLEKECEVQGLLKEETPVQGLVKKETSTEEVNCKMQTFK